jgi:release factor glutamine methyltransferase
MLTFGLVKGLTPRTIMLRFMALKPSTFGRSSSLSAHYMSSGSVHAWPVDKVSYQDGYKLAWDYLQSHEVSEAEINARYLLSDVLAIGNRLSDFHREVLDVSDEDEKVMTSSQLKQLNSHVVQRSKGVPLQYILGNWDFYGLIFKCREPVLIPRPETEELVEYILTKTQLSSFGKCQVLDIGAGTGAIGITLVHELTDIYCTALDINPIAVALANENAKSLLSSSSDQYTCRAQSFLEHAKDVENQGKGDLIVSNPPYIPSHDMDTLQREVKEYEDERALHGGSDGLSIIKDILDQAAPLLSKEGTQELWLEVDRSHPDKIERYVNSEDYRGQFEVIQKINDLSTNPRFVRLRCKH